MRQAQIVVGAFSAAGAILALAVDRWFVVLPLIFGCGLLFAGVTGTCGMALLLARMPWNRGRDSSCRLLYCGVNMKSARKILIVGGVAGGASAAARARRVDESAEIAIFERGPHISFANCGLPYHISGEIQDHSKLLIMTPEKMWSRSRVQVHVNHEVLSIDRSAQDHSGPP